MPKPLIVELDPRTSKAEEPNPCIRWNRHVRNFVFKYWSEMFALGFASYVTWLLYSRCMRYLDPKIAIDSNYLFVLFQRYLHIPSTIEYAELTAFKPNSPRSHLMWPVTRRGQSGIGGLASMLNEVNHSARVM